MKTNSRQQYIRMVDGKKDIMIEIRPGEFVNTVSAVKLGMTLVEQATLERDAA